MKKTYIPAEIEIKELDVTKVMDGSGLGLNEVEIEATDENF